MPQVPQTGMQILYLIIIHGYSLGFTRLCADVSFFCTFASNILP